MHMTMYMYYEHPWYILYLLHLPHHKTICMHVYTLILACSVAFCSSSQVTDLSLSAMGKGPVNCFIILRI